MNKMRYRWFWLRPLFLLPVLLMTFVSCSDDEEEYVPTLNIYVYAPDRAAVTRGEVVPTEEEALIHNLQIWVFRSSDPSKLVASLTLTEESELQGLNSNKSASYSIALSDRSFAEKPEPVDVYVLANVGYNGYLGSVYSSKTLEEAVFDGGHFFSFTQGPSYQAVSTVPADKGVPMSGVARGKSVIDKNNVLHINDANLKLVRTVSKIRFVASSLDGLEPILIEKMTLNPNMIYTKERFFLDGDHPNYWVEGAPFSQEVLLVRGDRVNPVAMIDDPAKYAYSSSMSDEDYEELINEGVSNKELREFGPVYLPESDKRLSGNITFRIGTDGKAITAPFSMSTGNFHRNQTWIVYAYYMGSSKLEINTVKVVDWEKVDPLPDHNVPNW